MQRYIYLNSDYTKVPSPSELRLKLIRLDMRLYFLELELGLRHKRNFNPSQPRIPSGNPDGGQWAKVPGWRNRNKLPHNANENETELVQRFPPSMFLEEPPIIPRPIIKEPFAFPKDLTKPPASGWECRGNGPPGSPRGSWINKETGEKLYPDMEHSPPKGPHLDYTAPNGQKFRWYPDGRMEPKIVVGVGAI